MLCYVMLCYIILYYILLYYLYYTVLYCIIVLFCFVLFCFVLFCFVLFCFVLFCLGLFYSQQQNALGYNPSMHGYGTVAIDGPRFGDFLRSRKGGRVSQGFCGWVAQLG